MLLTDSHDIITSCRVLWYFYVSFTISGFFNERIWFLIPFRPFQYYVCATLLLDDWRGGIRQRTTSIIAGIIDRGFHDHCLSAMFLHPREVKLIWQSHILQICCTAIACVALEQLLKPSAFGQNDAVLYLILLFIAHLQDKCNNRIRESDLKRALTEEPPN